MVHGRQDGNLAEQDEDAPGDGDEDLTHHNVPDVPTWLPEMDHEAEPEDVQRETDPENPFEPPRPADEPAGDEEEDEGDDAECVGDVSGGGHVDLVHNLQEGGEVRRVAEVGDLVGEIEQTGAQHGAIC